VQALGKYLKAAFLNQWNLLAFLGAASFALLSGAADVWLPIVLAGEVGYLGLLGTHNKFQRYVDAQDAKAMRGNLSENAQTALRRILHLLPRELKQKFGDLRKRCEDLREIALDLKQPGTATSTNPLDDVQLAGLDRLLWIYLKLLFTKHSLDRFFQTTREVRIRGEISRVEERIGRVEKSTNSRRDAMLETLEDNLKTCNDRLENFTKAKDNLELVELEIERLENKIRSLSELAVNRQEPEFISGQVEVVASSMLATEATINELEFVTGLHGQDDHVPALLRKELVSS
jgi:DNA repair exonuclease SbcCD ATPase subunit